MGRIDNNRRRTLNQFDPRGAANFFQPGTQRRFREFPAPSAKLGQYGQRHPGIGTLVRTN